MPCYHPIDAWQTETKLVFQPPPSWPGRKAQLQIPCGQCIGCRLEYSRQWAMRCMHEAQLHDANCFVTLTYSDENIPYTGTLVKRDLQLFFKRLRKNQEPNRVRFYACGEYGDKTSRPHYHAVIFNYYPADGIPISGKGSNKLYYSPSLERIWKLGMVSFGALTFDSAAYVARYVTKKITGDLADSHYERVDPSTGEIVKLLPEFSLMSRRPGIGRQWYEQFRSDTYPSDEVIMRGSKMQPPKYYDRLLEQEDPELLEQLKAARVKAAKKNKDNNTTERLNVREAVAHGKLGIKKRVF